MDQRATEHRHQTNRVVHFSRSMLDDIEEVELQGDAVKHKLHQTEDKLAKMTLKLNEAEQQLRENEQRLRLAEWHSGIMKRQLDMSKEDYHNLEDTVKRESEEYKLELARIEETHESEVARLRQDMRKVGGSVAELRDEVHHFTACNCTDEV